VSFECLYLDVRKFNGDPSFREKVSLKLGSFLDYYVTKRHHPQTHHRLEDTNLSLYLSQLPIKMSSVNHDMDPSSKDRNHMISITTPDIIKSLNLQSHIHQTNLWMNVHKSITNYHFDANHNFLCVLEGSKEVSLVSPEHLHLAHLNPFYSTACNHSHCFPFSRQLRGSCKSNETFNSSDMVNETSGHPMGPRHEQCLINAPFVSTCTLYPGDFLFIPEGWLHGIVSTPLTTAVSIWFHSILHDTLTSPCLTHILPYLLRQTSRQLVEQEVKSICETRDDDTNNVGDGSAMSAGFEEKCLKFYDEYVNSDYNPSLSERGNDGSSDDRSCRCKRQRVVSLDDKVRSERDIFVSPSLSMFSTWPQFASKVRNLCYWSTN